MISGGKHNQNLFDLNFGQYELDKDIKKLTQQIQTLDDEIKAKK